jgi:hypothetical protein
MYHATSVEEPYWLKMEHWMLTMVGYPEESREQRPRMQMRITLMGNRRIRIRNKVKSWIRIRI